MKLYVAGRHITQLLN